MGRSPFPGFCSQVQCEQSQSAPGGGGDGSQGSVARHRVNSRRGGVAETTHTRVYIMHACIHATVFSTRRAGRRASNRNI